MRSKTLKRLLSWLLSLCMVATLLPATAWAVDRIDGTMTATVYTGTGDYGAPFSGMIMRAAPTAQKTTSSMWTEHITACSRS